MDRDPLIAWKDLAALVAMGTLLPGAWLLPPPCWRPLAYALARISNALHPRRTREVARAMRETLGAVAPDLDVSHAGHRYRAGFLEQHLHYLREHRPGGWQPRLQLLGTEHLDHALRAGQGAVLWAGPFMTGGLVALKALHARGYGVHLLMRDWHWISRSRFGRALVNPVRQRVERRYARKVVMIQRDRALAVTRRLQALLAKNEIVFIMASALGRQALPQPLFGATVRLATGAPALAAATGAALLPVVTRQTGDDAYEVIIEAPLGPPAAGARRAAVQSLGRQFAQRLEPYICAHPAAFRDWQAIAGARAG